MSDIPTSIINLPFPKAFTWILTFHLSNGDRVWDPTHGEAHSWKDYKQQQKHKGFGLCPTPKLDIVGTDIKSGTDFQNTTFKREFDACFFDPPYIWGLKKTTDNRDNDYGEYQHTKMSLQTLVKTGFSAIHRALKKNGKLFFKYTDVFSMDDRCFHFSAEVWGLPPDGFDIIDHYIIQHHHINPRAYQVKDRPCSVNNHTYITVMAKQ